MKFNGGIEYNFRQAHIPLHCFRCKSIMLPALQAQMHTNRSRTCTYTPTALQHTDKYYKQTTNKS